MADDDHTTDELEHDTVATRRIAPVSLLSAGRKLRDGRYTLERPLGYGGMAAVWLARDERLGRDVAIKVLSDTLAGDEEYLTRFRREARVAARLTHPNLVAIYDYEATERPYLVMEYIEGGNLGERIEAGDVPDPQRLARELLSALRHIHAAGVLHRDVKPPNVLIGADGRARLTDFGIAQPRDATSLTQTGQVVGTERYLAPEIMAGEPASELSDLYSLGVVLDEAAGAAGDGAELRELIDALRAELPEDRPASATGALAVFERGHGPAGIGEPTRPLEAVPAPLDEPTPATEGLATEGLATEPRTPVPPPWERRPEAAGPGGRDGEPGAEADDEERRRRLVAALALATVAVALIVGLAIGSGGDDQPGGGERSAAAEGGGGEGSGGEQPAPPPETTAGEPTEGGGGGGGEATDPYALNDEGRALIDAGDPAAAIPLLERAVDGLRGAWESNQDIYYAYALFNLGQALRLAGQPEEAIPWLEERLKIPNQRGTVAAELELARDAAAGEAPSGGTEAGGGEEASGGVKPGNGPKPGRGTDKFSEEDD
ncbi:MAG: serine/threonine-protein kinase [Solirubrobacterales bacterium]